MIKKIGLTYNLIQDWHATATDPVDATIDFYYDIESIEFIKNTFQNAGYEVLLIGNVKNLVSLLYNNALQDTLVFNLSSGEKGRNRESQAACLLELYNIPYTGSDALTLGISQDKIIAKNCFIANHIPTPRYFHALPGSGIETSHALHFPLLVKTQFEGTSKGITEASHVTNQQQLKQQIERIYTDYQQPALVEEFIEGREFTVGIIGNTQLDVMPIKEYVNDKIKGKSHFYMHPYDEDNFVIHACPANISENLAAKLRQLAISTYNAVGCRDYGRIDFRVDAFENPYVLEINPLPDLSNEPINAFVQYANILQIPYEDIIKRILKEALERLKIYEEPYK